MHTQIEQRIKKGTYPLMVLEGKSKQKVKKIKETPYLRHSFKQLMKATGSLFIFGSSLNMKSDKHVVNAIKKSELDPVYVGVYGKDSKLISKTREYFNNKKLYFFDSKKIISWQSIP